MSTPAQFEIDVRNMLEEFNRELPAINIRLSKSALSLLKNRIINDGENAKGNKMESYSDNELPTWFFKGKGISAGADAKLKEKIDKGEGVSYKDWRGMNGLQTNHRDLKFSGDMWRDIDVLQTIKTNEGVSTFVGAKNSIARGENTTDKIMSYNAEQIGDFMNLTPEEESVLDKALDKDLQTLIDKYL